jgi:O-antigen/teichoic acid export membrane protein
MTLFRNSLFSLAGTAVPLFVAILTVPIYLDVIGAERYGALALAWLMLGYFGQADFGIGRAVTQRVARLGDDALAARAGVVWSALLAIGLVGALGSLAIFLAGNWFFGHAFEAGDQIRREMVRSVWLLALCSPVVAITGTMTGTLIGLNRFRIASTSTMVGNSAMQIFPLLAVMAWGDDLMLLIAASICARLLGMLIASVGVYFSALRGQRIAAPREQIFQLLHFGKWVMVTAIVGPLMVFADRFVIGATIGAAAVAAYTVPFQIASRTMVFPRAVIQALFPRLSAESDSDSWQRCQRFTLFIGQIYAPLVVALICLAGPLLSLWLGRNLDPRSIFVGQIILAGFWISAVASVPFAFIQARGNPRYTALLQIFELPIYGLLLGVLGWRFGLYGVAAAFSLRCLLDCILLVRKAKIDLSQVGILLPQTLIILGAVAAHPWLMEWTWSVAAFVVLTGLTLIIGMYTAPPMIMDRIRSTAIGQRLAPIIGPRG